MFGMTKATGSDMSNLYVFDITMANGDVFSVLRSCEFANGIFVETRNVYAVDNEELFDVENGVIRHDDLMSYGRPIRLLMPSGESYIQINPKQISSIDCVSIVENANMSELIHR